MVSSYMNRLVSDLSSHGYQKVVILTVNRHKRFKRNIMNLHEDIRRSIPPTATVLLLSTDSTFNDIYHGVASVIIIVSDTCDKVSV